MLNADESTTTTATLIVFAKVLKKKKASVCIHIDMCVYRKHYFGNPRDDVNSSSSGSMETFPSSAGARREDGDRWCQQTAAWHPIGSNGISCVEPPASYKPVWVHW